MYRADSGDSAINSVWAAEGEFKFQPGIDSQPNLQLQMVYMNGETQRTYGTCPARTNMFSPETMEAFMDFLKSAEKDFGELVFGGGEVGDFGALGGGGDGPGSTDGIKPKGLGGV